MAFLSERSGEIIPHAAGLHISPTGSDLRAGGEAGSVSAFGALAVPLLPPGCVRRE